MMRILLFILCCALSLKGSAQTLLPIPDTLGGAEISLNIHKDSVQFFTGIKSNTYAFNQYHYLGPTLFFHKNKNVSIHVKNSLNDTTTIHWHGIHLPPIFDGGPHTPILPNDSWNPKFTIKDHAATYWYHPHMHMKTAEQAIKGAAGLIIVKDSIESALNLPRSYGNDDIPLVIQCQQYDSLNQAMPLGMQDSTILVNGALANNGHEVYANLPAQIVRLRILNASGERTFNFGLSGNKNFTIIGSDGGLLNTPVNTNRIRLSPGERSELLLDLNGFENQTLYLMCYGSELPMGVQGGPTMPMPKGPPMNSPLNGIDFHILTIKVGVQSLNPVTTIPKILVNQNPLQLNDVITFRTIKFTADNMMVMDGPFYFNDSSFDMMRIDYFIPINNVEGWKLINETMVAHPFHIHDVQFNLVEREGNTPLPQELGRKDVVLVLPYDSVMFLTKFEDFTDTIVPYMYHCHILMHEDDGMMGQFLVVPKDFSAKTRTYIHPLPNSIYPNPTDQEIHIQIPGKIENFDIRITDQLGKVMYSRNQMINQTINVNHLTAGIYTVLIRANKTYYCAKFIKK